MLARLGQSQERGITRLLQQLRYAGRSLVVGDELFLDVAVDYHVVPLAARDCFRCDCRVRPVHQRASWNANDEVTRHTQQKSNVRAVICCAESTCYLGHGEASTRVIVDDQVGTVEVPPEANVNCESGLRLVMEVVRCIEHGRARAQ